MFHRFSISVALVASGIVLNGCTTLDYAPEFSPEVSKIQDPYLNIDTIAGSVFGEPVFRGPSLQLLYYLDHDRLLFSGPYLRIVHYRSHREAAPAIFVTSARTIESTHLKVAACNQDVQQYGTCETTVLLIPQDYLSSHQATGALIKLYGMNGAEEEIAVPAKVISAFLAGSRSLLEEHGIPEGQVPNNP